MNRAIKPRKFTLAGDHRRFERPGEEPWVDTVGLATSSREDLAAVHPGQDWVDTVPLMLESERGRRPTGR
jgi:hypothetical protein